MMPDRPKIHSALFAQVCALIAHLLRGPEHADLKPGYWTASRGEHGINLSLRGYSAGTGLRPRVA
jgi:hypothetical protein